MQNLSLYELNNRKLNASKTEVEALNINAASVNGFTLQKNVNANDIFLTEQEKAKLLGIQDKAEVNQNSYSTISIINDDTTVDVNASLKTDKFKIKSGTGIDLNINPSTKELTINSFNQYIHPEKHPASIIEENANKKFVTEDEKIIWNNKANGSHIHDIADINGLQSEIDNLKLSVGNGKQAIAAAITEKGIEANGSDTFEELSQKIIQINYSLSDNIKYEIASNCYKTAKNVTVNEFLNQNNVISNMGDIIKLLGEKKSFNFNESELRYYINGAAVVYIDSGKMLSTGGEYNTPAFNDFNTIFILLENQFITFEQGTKITAYEIYKS